MKALVEEAHKRIVSALPEDEPDCVPDWVCELVLKLGMELATDALRLVLPMAKGYAAANPVGSNGEYIRQAEALLAAQSGHASSNEGTAKCQKDVVAPVLQGEREWLALAYAPMDGTEVELLIQHRNYRYAKEADKANWEQIVKATWIDFNDGGWTWSGLAGTPVGWRPLDSEGAAPSSSEAAVAAPVELSDQQILERAHRWLYQEDGTRGNHYMGERHWYGTDKDICRFVRKMLAAAASAPVVQASLTEREMFIAWFDKECSGARYLEECKERMYFAFQAGRAAPKPLLAAQAVPINQGVRATDSGEVK